MRRFLLLVGLLVMVVVPGAAVLAQADPDAAAQKAVEYIRTQQAADGTFAGFGPGSTADAIFAIAAAGVNAAEIKNGQASAIDGLTRLAPEAAKDPGVAAKFVIAALTAGQSPQTLGGSDLVAIVEQAFDQATGRYGKDLTSHALSLVALRAAGSTIRPEAVRALEQAQLPDGGWSFDGTEATGSDTNTTALALQALVAAGGSDEARQKAIAYLKAQQNADGGFPYSQTSQFGNASDANSTAAVIQAILASGDDPNNWAKDGQTPVARLLAFQNPNGAFRFQDAQPDDNQLATYQAVPTLQAKTLPLESIAIALAQPAETATAGATATGPVAETAVVTGTATVATAAPLSGTGAITDTAGPAAEPVRLPDTGRFPTMLLPVIFLGLFLLIAGLALRHREA